MIRALCRTLCTALPIFLLVATAQAAPSGVLLDTDHSDFRATAKLRFEPSWDAPQGLSGEDLARAYLSAHAKEFGLSADLASLRLESVKESLLANHFEFQQSVDGIDIDGAEVIVSVTKQDGRVSRAFNNAHPLSAIPVQRQNAALGSEQAYDAAWQHVRGHGSLLSAPRARLVWTPEGENLRLNWIVDLDLDAPFGAWRVRVDAQTGEAVEAFDIKIYRKAEGIAVQSLADRLADWDGPATDRQVAFGEFAAREAAHAAALAEEEAAALRAAGTGVVFDPDPRATLMDDTLQDGSPASAFTAAYFTRDLQDIQLSGGTYRLTGPWINIINFESPATAPSTTTDGNWTAVRGNNAFNDAMTYFQIDQNQRYMQSLGFTGAMGIQDGSIGVDTDGLSGADNSHYIPSSNRMAFGHGCVDDSEDTDVMLHEYGHAINYSINSSWGGGDMGAIGEGFGDYWCGSYSYSTPNGEDYHPEWAFSWDGHGQGNQCWPGRIMNAFGARYVHTTFYGAHQGIPGGYQSDELWSTPCFQSLVELVRQGRTREEVDTIILESQFGLGSGLKMRDMANAIIATAGDLFPGGPHADVFIQKFLVHNIVEIPHVALAVGELAFTSAGGNGAADPGETVAFTIEVNNLGTLGATAVVGTLATTTPGVTIGTAVASYPDLGVGGSGTNLTDFTLSIDPDFVCGDPVALTLTVEYDDGDPSSVVLFLEMGTGVPQGAAASISPELAIPDNNSAGVRSDLVVAAGGALVTTDINIDINLTHTWIGDLIVRLTSPNGTTVTLHNRSGSSADDIIGNYPLTLNPAQSLSAFLGEPLDGTWSMFVSDNAGQDTGVLHSWGINDVSGYDCDDDATAVITNPGAPLTFALLPNQPNPFVVATSFRFAVPGSGDAVSLRIFDIAGRVVRTLHEGFAAAGEHAVTWNGEDETGMRVGAGIYFAHFESAEFAETRKVVLLK